MALLASVHHSPDVLVPITFLGLIKLFDELLLFIRVNDELLDVFGEHRQSFVFLRVGQPSSELNVLGVDYNLIVRATATNTAS